MASEYLKMKAREQAPQEPPPALTPAERRKNWWHYHWGWVAVVAVLLLVVGSIVWNLLGIGRTEPDYIFAYVGRGSLDEALAADLEEQLALLGEDVNGDGLVRVELRQYALDRGGDLETALYYNYAADTTLMADLSLGESYFFLTPDPQGVQRSYQILACADGTPPDDNDYSVTDKVYAWADCPALAGLTLDQSALSGFYLGRRCFYGEAALGREAQDAFWQIITKGATR